MKEIENTLLLEILGASPKIRIINFLLDFPMNDFTKEELVKNVRMSKTTFYASFKILTKYQIVLPSRKIGRAILYRINLEHPIVMLIKELEHKLSDFIAESKEKRLLVKVK
jgi:DNA-binding transcriptional ArsR family regulator